MDYTLNVFCLNTGTNIAVEPGKSLLELAKGLDLGFEPISALVNNRHEHMSFRIYRPRTVRFIAKTDAAGQRAYVRSLCMMLYCAISRVCPQAVLTIEHSLSGGYFCRLGRDVECTPELVEAIAAEMRSLVERDLPFVLHEVPAAEAIEVFKRQGLTDKVELLESAREMYTKYYSLDGIADNFYSVLAPSTGMVDVWQLRPFKDGLLMMGFDAKNPSQPAAFVPQEKMFKAFTDYIAFNKIIGVDSVNVLNRAIESGHTADLVNVSEALHEKALTRIADEITRRYRQGGARVVLISGPSSSGKTTSTKRLAIQLMTNLLRPQMISLDDYFVDRVHTPRDEKGDYDYESLYALDLEQFNRDLADILAGKEVALPTYNFQTGQREYRGNTISLTPGSILLIEGIHGLNPELTAQIPDELKFRLYVSALTTINIDGHNWIPTTDNRLLRRIIRDNSFRGTDALNTIRRWPGVRRGEEKWIFPYQENADAMFNSSLLYELAVLGQFAEPLLKQVPRDTVEYCEAQRLLRFIHYFKPIALQSVPSTSLMREFLGGSSFRY